ncbi:LysR family transcriptional regulator [Klebsiella sp. NPDC088457]
MISSSPNWNDLRIFLEVYRTGSFSGAARQLKMDVSTVSRHIASLERFLSTPVFERNPAGLKMTLTGKELLSHVEAMEANSLAMLDSKHSGHGQHPAGEVRIATMEGIASFYLSGQFIAFHQKYPQIHLELITSSQQVHVNRREADLFLSFYPYEGKGLDILPVGKFSLYLYASPDYLHKQGVPATVSILEKHTFVSYIEDLIELDTVRWLNEYIEKPTVIFSSTSMVAQMFAAIAGGGIVMLPEFMHAEKYGLTRIPLNEIVVSRTVWLSVHRELRYLPKMKVVIAFLRDIFLRDFPAPPGIRIS